MAPALPARGTSTAAVRTRWLRVVPRVVAVLAAVALAVLPALPAAAATWVWPLVGPHLLTRPFAPGPEPWSPGHRGVDLPALPGEPVRAAGAGVVRYAGLLAGRGVLVVDHGELRTTYEPVTPLVGVGARVAAGEVVATVDAGHLGCPAPACLHWGLRRGEDYLDPVRLVEPGPVRLLPREDAGAAGLGVGSPARQDRAVEPASVDVDLGAAGVEPAGSRSEPAGSRSVPSSGVPPGGGTTSVRGRPGSSGDGGTGTPGRTAAGVLTGAAVVLVGLQTGRRARRRWARGP